MKLSAIICSLLPLSAMAFMPTAPIKASSSRTALKMAKEWADEPAGVKWFPKSAPYWVSSTWRQRL